MLPVIDCLKKRIRFDSNTKEMEELLTLTERRNSRPKQDTWQLRFCWTVQTHNCMQALYEVKIYYHDVVHGTVMPIMHGHPRDHAKVSVHDR